MGSIQSLYFIYDYEVDNAVYQAVLKPCLLLKNMASGNVPSQPMDARTNLQNNSIKKAVPIGNRS